MQAQRSKGTLFPLVPWAIEERVMGDGHRRSHSPSGVELARALGPAARTAIQHDTSGQGAESISVANI